ncbi:MAG TPA: TonB-dependent receptor, partial [Acidobacteriaceae bacterium]|nr:TonB-dependent receptor [Acidobacteriaceae bacterium]
TNTQTSDIRNTISNAEGFFAFSGTEAGNYTVKVESQGFRSAEETGIHVGPGDRRNLNVTLGVATADATVTVNAGGSSIVVDSGDLSSTLYESNIKKLALQGRDVTELLKTLPGFNVNTSYNGVQNKPGYDTQVTSIASSVGRGITANGAPDRAGGADLLSDGAHILDPGCNCNANQTVNPDMVSEVKVTTSAYGADSTTGPIVVSAVGKSGSSTYHGSAYLHFRDHSMNSNDWIYKHQTPAQARPNDRYWYPGGQIGGPVPFTHKKLVFFTGYEYYNQSFPEQTSGGLLKALVPTLSERAGHFDPTLPDNAAVCGAVAGWISSQYRCQPITSIDTANGYVGGISNSDVSRYLGPGAQSMLKMIPLPNHTPSADADYNWVKPLINTNNGYMFHAKTDYNLSDSTKLYVSYNQQHELYGSPVQRWWIPADSIDTPGGPATSAMSRTLSGNFVKVFSPTTTNEFIAGLSYLYDPITFANEKAVDRTALNYPYAYPGSSTTIMPNIMNSWWTNDMGIPQMFDTGRGSYFERKWQPSIDDNFTRVLRTHTIKFGVSWMQSADRGSNVGQTDGPNGTAQYGPVWDYNGPGGTQITSAYNPVLDFMLDMPSNFATLPVTISDMKDSGWGFYGQDEWKVSKRLTVNFGLRLSHDLPWEDASGKYGASAWSRAWYDADLAKGITSLPGMRWHAIDSSVPLAGRSLNAIFYAPRFGVALDVYGNGKTFFRGGFGTYYYRDGLGGSSGTSTAQGGTQCTLSSPTFLSQIDAGKNIQCANTGAGITSGSAVDPNDHVEPQTYTYNFTVSQQLVGKSMLELTYSGSQSSDLINNLADVNKIPIGAFLKPDPNPASSNYGKQFSIDNIKDTVLQDYRPLTHYTSMNVIRHGAWANYNALQASWQKQQGALTYNLNYTWSKTLGINGSEDPINIQNDYGILGQDRTHALNVSWAYEVGSRFHNRLEAVALNGWLVSGIDTLQSGAPLQESFSQNLGFQGSNTLPKYNTLNSTYYLGTPDYTLMPNLVCNPAGGLSGGAYINAKCFTAPATPQFDSNGVLTGLGGQGPYHMPYLHGPAYFTNDLSLARTIRITEHQNAQIKFTGLNFLNHPLTSFDQNNANNLNLNFTNGALKTQDKGWAYGVPNEKFGRRVLELSLRYNF